VRRVVRQSPRAGRLQPFGAVGFEQAQHALGGTQPL
jgi:hypothetical protein